MATAVNNSNRSSLFVNSPGKARATIPGHGINAHGPQGKTATVGGCLNRKGNPASSPTKGNCTKRYFKQFSYKTNGPETGATCSANSCFQSFKIDFRPIAEPVTLAGRLRLFLPNWQQITVDPAILDVVRVTNSSFLLHQVKNAPDPPCSFRTRSRRKSTPRLLPS